LGKSRKKKNRARKKCPLGGNKGCWEGVFKKCKKGGGVDKEKHAGGVGKEVRLGREKKH